MKKLSIVIFVSLLVCAYTLRAETAKEIIEKTDKMERVESSIATVKQIITTSSGKKRTLTAKSYSIKRGEKQLSEYTAPKRVKGDKILMLNDGDDIWFYTPKTDRVRHLASHAKRRKVQGSDFAYEDMQSGSIDKKFEYKLLGSEEVDGRQCYKFEFIPKPNGPHYSKLIVWIDKEMYITVRTDFYEDGDLLKRLTMSGFEKVSGHWYPMKMVMKNIAEGGQTIMETVDIKINCKVDSKKFTTRSLKKK